MARRRQKSGREARMSVKQGAGAKASAQARTQARAQGSNVGANPSAQLPVQAAAQAAARDSVAQLRVLLQTLDKIEAGAAGLGLDLGTRGQVFQSSGSVKTSLGSVNARRSTGALHLISNEEIARILVAAAAGQAVDAGRLCQIIGTAMLLSEEVEAALQAAASDVVTVVSRDTEYRVSPATVKAFLAAAKSFAADNSALLEASKTASPKKRGSAASLVIEK